MATVLYHCPNTGFRVQGYTADETMPRDRNAYEAVTCLACKQVHLVNPKMDFQELISRFGLALGIGLSA